MARPESAELPAAERHDATTSMLDQIGVRHGVKQASTGRDLLRQHEEMLRSLSLDITDVVLVLGVDAAGTANTFAEFFPDATIHLLSVHELKRGPEELAANVRHANCASITARVAYLKQIPRPQVIIENGNNRKGQKLACFRQLSLFLPPGGVYVVEELHAVTIGKLTDCDGDDIAELLNRLNLLRLSIGEPELPDDAELAESIASVTFGNDVAYVRKRNSHRVKLRDAEANAVLCARFGRAWGEILRTVPTHDYRSATQVINHGDGPIQNRESIKVPERHLRRYEDAVCQPRQRLLLDGYYLPDTFRHPLQSRLNHREIINASPHVGRDVDQVAPAQRLEGTYFYFDTEYPGHFGHVLTEVLGRYWGWVAAREIDPGIRPLISLDPGAEAIPDFQRVIFDSLDIPTSRIAYVQPGSAVQVESIVAATSAFAMPHYADDSLRDVWGQIRQRLVGQEEAGAELVFSSRRQRRIRSCRNTEQVESFFAERGFSIVYPEDFAFAEQVKIFSGAKVIAGFAGSNMFCTMFAPGATKIILSGNAYTANNEHLIAAVVGGDVHNVWGRSEVQHPKGKWAWSAFQSNFSIDLSVLESAVRPILSG